MVLIRRTLYVFLAFGWLFGGASALRAAEPIALYSYYLEPPYEMGEGKGLTHELASYLNRRAGGRLHFEVRNLPRKRLDRLMEKGEPLVLPWASPDWFPGLKNVPHHWSGPYIQGADMLIVNADDHHISQSLESLKDCTLIGVIGFYYPGLDELVAAKQINRRDYTGYDEVFRLISARPGNCTVASTITAKFLIRSMDIEQKVRIVDESFDTFTRHFLAVDQPHHVREFLDETARTMHEDREWLKVLTRYGLHNLADRTFVKK